jgi:2-oxoisovalerate dehydrogenase E1 component
MAFIGMRSDGREPEELPYKEREDFDQFEQVRYSNAIASVTGRWMENDTTVVELGEEVANFGGNGAYGTTKVLPARFPERIVNTPISEAGFAGIACGAAITGPKPIVEIMFSYFPWWLGTSCSITSPRPAIYTEAQPIFPC